MSETRRRGNEARVRLRWCINFFHERRTIADGRSIHAGAVDEVVIDKDGGVLGLGTTQRIKADFNPASFKKIDITETSIIPIEAKKIEILSTHPSGSYELEKDANKMITKLVIKDPERFWEASKYLVVMKD